MIENVHDPLDFLIAPKDIRRASRRARLIVQVPQRNGSGERNSKFRLSFEKQSYVVIMVEPATKKKAAIFASAF